MKYTSCFIGIPIPKAFGPRLQQAAQEISAEAPSLAIADMRTLHITIYYLDEQSQLHIQHIRALVKEHAHLLAGATVTIGRMGLFGGEQPRVLYAQAKCSEGIYRFHDEVFRSLNVHGAADNSLDFTPHVTLARIGRADTNAFLEHREAMSRILDTAGFDFEVKEVCIYGVDSRFVPEHQTKLATIRIEGQR